jgi:hypothetical protein
MMMTITNGTLNKAGHCGFDSCLIPYWRPIGQPESGNSTASSRPFLTQFPKRPGQGDSKCWTLTGQNGRRRKYSRGHKVRSSTG